MQASVLQSFPFRAAVVAVCVLLIPLIPLPAAGGGDGGGGQAFVAKVWELLHLLFVGIAFSYGLFSRKNDGGGRRVDGGEKDAALARKTDGRYVSRMLQGDLVFDDDVDDGMVSEARSWSALHRPEEAAVMVADGGGGGRSSHALPVRALKPQDSGAASYSNGGTAAHETVLPSPIPWRSRTSSASPSLSDETPAKDSEEYGAVPKRTSTYRSSSNSSQPPAPPPPPPPFFIHGYHPVAERRSAAKSFKEELHDHSMRGREDHHTQDSFSNSSTSVGRSLRTLRARDAIQTQIQQQPNYDQVDDAPGNLRGSDSEETYGYRAYQSIPRFQYERESSDPILGRVTVSSDETGSSDDEDGAYSTRTNSPRESTPEVDENEVDKKAEEFIARFREQIRLQRIESIKKSAGPRGVKHGK